MLATYRQLHGRSLSCCRWPCPSCSSCGRSCCARLSRVWWFYLACVALGYCLFQAWPLAFHAAGYGFVESVILVTAVVNIHHFIVDAYIWRLRRDPNYRLIATDSSVPAVA